MFKNFFKTILFFTFISSVAFTQTVKLYNINNEAVQLDASQETLLNLWTKYLGGAVIGVDFFTTSIAKNGKTRIGERLSEYGTEDLVKLVILKYTQEFTVHISNIYPMTFDDNTPMLNKYVIGAIYSSDNKSFTLLIPDNTKPMERNKDVIDFSTDKRFLYNFNDYPVMHEYLIGYNTKTGIIELIEKPLFIAEMSTIITGYRNGLHKTK